MLVAARAAGARPGTTTEILRLALTGFGVWHLADAIVFHWLLGLHRVKMNSDMPLAWDLVWLVMFGIVPLLLVLVLPNRGGPARGASAALTGIVLLAGLAAGASPLFNGAATSVIVFRSGMEPAAMMRAVQAADVRLKWVDASGTIWAVDRVSSARPGRPARARGLDRRHDACHCRMPRLDRYRRSGQQPQPAASHTCQALTSMPDRRG
ncbi:DUF2243 domain-containing protein [Mesorhizobium sp. LNHC209A00]|uniref:DUF2243 domain-containing protein n=1 Tax=Mesorhizobium sp. LNHC209A00 TaxID=1287226 RepID=UPI001FD88A03|nr:DUF2243 domain-containing protein [Mesorhizobium sp. LNHC209A00]